MATVAAEGSDSAATGELALATTHSRDKVIAAAPATGRTALKHQGTTDVPTAAFDDAVSRHLRGRSIRAVEREAGLPDSSLRNMRRRPTMPPASQIQTVATALGMPPEILTRALLADREYLIEAAPGQRDVAELSSVAQSLDEHHRRLLLGVAELIRDLSRK